MLIARSDRRTSSLADPQASWCGSSPWPRRLRGLVASMASRYPKAERAVRERYQRIARTLDERGRRLFAANESLAIGYGGDAAVNRATGLSRNAIARGRA